MSKGIDKEATIRTHYAELNKFGQNGEYEKAIKAANKSESPKRKNHSTNKNVFFFSTHPQSR